MAQSVVGPAKFRFPRSDEGKYTPNTLRGMIPKRFGFGFISFSSKLLLWKTE